ncbi:hypothetical protein A3734_18470, partial [Sulfitobacter sp. HI0054]|uniref:hypothetical protein n=1 Tax=Sulfitobacter sp. HI0054 TaxID=1822238 RepID=UPI0007C2A0F6
WIKTKSADGISYSVQLKPKTDVEPEDVLERIADRLDNIRPAPAIKRPTQTRSDVRNFIPTSDVHMSMRVGDYGTAECVDRLKAGTADLTERLPPAECTVIVANGDYTEANDPSNLTPQSKHPLAVDMEYDDTTDIAVEVEAWRIEHALTRSDHVIYKALRGNHDPQTARIIRAALKQRYRNEPRVTIETDGIEVFAHAWEGNFIACHHGDLKKNPTEFVLAFATAYPQMWAGAIFRELWVGHLHRLKEISADQTGMTFNQVRAIAPLGRHAIENLYNSPSEMIGVAYRKGGGRLLTLNHGFWN